MKNKKLENNLKRIKKNQNELEKQLNQAIKEFCEKNHVDMLIDFDVKGRTIKTRLVIDVKLFS